MTFKVVKVCIGEVMLIQTTTARPSNKETPKEAIVFTQKSVGGHELCMPYGGLWLCTICMCAC